MTGTARCNRKESVDFEEMANTLLNIFDIVTERHSKVMYFYENNTGIYNPNGEEALRETATTLSEAQNLKLTKHTMNEVTYRIQSKTFIDASELNKYPHLIHLGNCILDTKTMKTTPFSKDIIATQRIPIDYEPEATCPAFLRFLQEVLRLEDIPLIQEMFGWTLTKEYKPQKAFILLGGGANGKSTLLNVLIHLIGKENVTSIEFRELKERFMSIELFGKLANICMELSSGKISETVLFKRLTGDDQIKGEKKNKDPMYFWNFAKLIFSTNQLPVIDDDSIAFYRRWILIEFPNSFEGDAIDMDKLTKITSESELQGILIWAIEGLRRLREKAKFSTEDTPDDIAEKWEQLSNPLHDFVLEYIVETGNKRDFIDRDGVFKVYQNSTIGHGLSQREFNHRFKRLCKKAWQGERSRDNGGKVSVWRGIRWREDDDRNVVGWRFQRIYQEPKART